MTDSNTSSQVGAPSPAAPPARPNSAVAAVLLEIPWECLALVVIVAVGLCVGLSVAVHALWTRYSDHGSRGAAEARLSSSGDFRSYAAATDAVQCAPVTRFIFERNGSVADAAIATFLCACVVLPHAVGIGGGFIALIYDRKENATHVLDAREVAPLAARPDMFIQNTEEAVVGGRAVAVPGVVHGLGELHRRFGRLPWAELFTPAVNLARFGFPVGPELAAALAGAQTMFDTNLRARAHFWNDVSNMPYREGETLKQPFLADALEAIANDSATAFYNGRIAKALVRDLRSIEHAQHHVGGARAAHVEPHRRPAHVRRPPPLRPTPPRSHAARLIALCLPRLGGRRRLHDGLPRRAFRRPVRVPDVGRGAEQPHVRVHATAAPDAGLPAQREQLHRARQAARDRHGSRLARRPPGRCAARHRSVGGLAHRQLGRFCDSQHRAPRHERRRGHRGSTPAPSAAAERGRLRKALLRGTMVSEFWQNNSGTKKAIIIYTTVVAITTIFEARFGYSAINDLSDYADRPERFSRLGLHVFLQTVHFFMCLYWIYAARQDYLPGMSFAYSAMVIRTCGNFIYTATVACYELFVLPRTVVNVIKIASWIPTELRLWYGVFWLVIEVYVLSRLHAYTSRLREASSETASPAQGTELEGSPPDSPTTSSPEEEQSPKKTRSLRRDL
ncbi:uncharacterized protein LOC119161928 [Rhipicephalus microplus]|uniref:uncharacterized protein LOC119161928 n=1 Tax=Rhipicephalus microplus TaxID=6941 RepID=UPI003F6A5755